jgi:PAB-dependent poly(A)-specific ribonuclease subunit 3
MNSPKRLAATAAELGASQTLCRNITIHGYCKWADKGCRFAHNDGPKTPNAATATLNTSAKLRPETPTFTPNGLMNAPVFVPRQPAVRTTLLPQADLMETGPPTGDAGFQSSPARTASGMPSMMQDSFSYDTYRHFQPLQYHLYGSLRPNRKSLASNERSSHELFISDDLREQLTKKQEAVLQTLQNSNLPASVHNYHSLVPLDLQPERSSRVFGYPSFAYKATSKQDGETYCLRRIEGFRLQSEVSITLIEKWRKVHSAGVVEVREAFTSKSFMGDSILFVYAYHPLSSTLYDKHIRQRKPCNEAILWSYLTQLYNALRAIHACGLACKLLDLTKVLVTEKNRIRINCCGMLDVLQYDPSADVKQQQQMDLTQAAALVLGLAHNDAELWPDARFRFDLTTRGYSARFNDFMHTVLEDADNGCPVSLQTILADLGEASMESMDAALVYNDTLEAELATSTENGRLVRLLCKFGFINERPEFEHDPAWSETGDRYLLKLFRDYVFHQVNERGQPVLDLGHVLSCLNKLDAGTEERVMLVSRDETSSIIATYRELRALAESAFNELRRRS